MAKEGVQMRDRIVLDYMSGQSLLWRGLAAADYVLASMSMVELLYKWEPRGRPPLARRRSCRAPSSPVADSYLPLYTTTVLFLSILSF
jgi:hypothetical protein